MSYDYIARRARHVLRMDEYDDKALEEQEAANEKRNVTSKDARDARAELAKVILDQVNVGLMGRPTHLKLDGELYWVKWDLADGARPVAWLEKIEPLEVE